LIHQVKAHVVSTLEKEHFCTYFTNTKQVSYFKEDRFPDDEYLALLNTTSSWSLSSHELEDSEALYSGGKAGPMTGGNIYNL